MVNWIKNIFKKDNHSGSDDFIKRIRSLVIGEGMLNDGNIDLLKYAITKMPEFGAVVEIGSYGGLSTNLICYLLKKQKRNNTFFSCDAWIYEGFNDKGIENKKTIDGRDDVLRSAYSLYMKNAFINATKFLSYENLPHSFQMYSDTFFKKWNNKELETDLFGESVKLGGLISFAYIDGGHSYEVAWNDFLNVSNNLQINGYVLIDDSADSSNFGSAKMINRIKKDKRFTIAGKNPNYLFKKIA